MLISIIVPVYNTAPYLKDCIDSLLAQSHKQLELIIINDGSTDQSAEILKGYAKYPNISMLRQQNKGLGAARNAGIQAARGDYIGFVDSDDWVHPEMFERLAALAQSEQLDIVACDAFAVQGRRKKRIPCRLSHKTVCGQKLKQSMLNIFVACWNKLYKRELFDTVLFHEGIWYEDADLLYRLYPKLRRMGAVHEPLYYYRQRAGAITGVYDRRLFQFIKNFEGILAHYQSIGQYEEYKAQLEYLYIRYAFGTMLKRLARSKDRDLYRTGVQYAKQQVLGHFPAYRGNRLFRTQGLTGIYLKWFNPLFSKIIYLSGQLAKQSAERP